MQEQSVKNRLGWRGESIATMQEKWPNSLQAARRPRRSIPVEKERLMKKLTSTFIACVAMFSLVFLFGSSRAAHAQADLIIATNAEVTFPSCSEELTYYYFFTVVDDGGGISTPVISNLTYSFTGPNQINTYDNGEFTYATFEVAVTIPAPPLGTTANDCFAITYEEEFVNPCFDVTRSPSEICEVLPACVRKASGTIRIVNAESACRVDESRVELGVATPNAADAETSAAPAPRER